MSLVIEIAAFGALAMFLQDAGVAAAKQAEAERAARCHAVSNRTDKLLSEQSHLIAPATLDALGQVDQLQEVLEYWAPGARDAAGWDAPRYYKRMGYYHDTEIDKLSHAQLAEAVESCLKPA